MANTNIEAQLRALERNGAWSVRDLKEVLGYSTWKRFAEAAKEAPQEEVRFVAAVPGKNLEDYVVSRDGARQVLENHGGNKPDMRKAIAFFSEEPEPRPQYEIEKDIEYTLNMIAAYEQRLQELRSERDLQPEE